MKKIEAKQINEWIHKAYDNAVKHGWHKEEKPNGHWLMMVCTEIAEAVQADRKGAYMDELDKEGLKTVLANDHGGGLFEKFYSENIENKVESELADICIRLFDFMGVRAVSVKDDITIFDTEIAFLKQHLFTEDAMFVNRNVISCDVAITNKGALIVICCSAIVSVFEWAEALNIDLVQHINLKMRYNESREYLHGNKSY